MLQSLLRQPLGRLSFSLAVNAGVIARSGVAQVPLFARTKLNILRTRGFLTSAPVLEKEGEAKVVKKRVVKATSTTKAKPKKKVVKKAVKAKKVVKKEPPVYKKDIVPPVKRPLYGFALFVKEFRAQSGSQGNLRQTLVDASAKWKEIGEQEKEKYNPDKGALTHYYEVMREWREGLGPRERKKIGLKAKQVPRPLSAYQIVLKNTFKENPGLSFKDGTELAREAYRNMTPEKKAQYKREAVEQFHAQSSA
ncbi:hypothetical protein CVT24_001463 [Panaeolus cyanescens]|uniref:HMG box domain-containing protein n=1 Tax=Panaeolus cyanescens TaxID=181874 RepID=A0A409VTG5_9AGAR|nr:hypothetical protein CVT24_001463 [Panaeolus cyanescens]